MNWQALLDSIPTLIVGFISGFGIAITKGVSKIIEDSWEDYRRSKKETIQTKKNIVSQLLFDIPRGKSRKFEVTVVKKVEAEQTLTKIAIYDRKMSRKVEEYLSLWSKYASAKYSVEHGEQIKQHLGEDLVENKEDEQIYLGDLLAQLYSRYDEIIDLLNTWKK